MFTKILFNHNKSRDPFAIKAVALFECEKCGFCCKFMPCELSEEEIPSYKKLAKPEDWEDATKLKAPCPFFDDVTSRCTIYDQRTIICKRFPVYPMINDFTQVELIRIFAFDHCPLAYDILDQLYKFCQKTRYPIPLPSPESMIKRNRKKSMKRNMNKNNKSLYSVIIMNLFETFIKWKKMKLEKLQIGK